MYRDEDILDKHPREYWENAIYQWVRDDIGRKVLIRSFLDYVPYEQIAEELNISRATVFNKVKKYSAKLFDNCD